MPFPRYPALENEQTNITGKQGNQNQITNNISDLETDQKVADTKSMGLISVNRTGFVGDFFI
ncbi:hypothetical protein ABTP93_15765 [Acinetobacter baumannii]